MKKLLLLLTAALFLHSVDTSARDRQLQVGGSQLPKGLSADRINQTLQKLHTSANTSYGLNKTTATERVATITNYDFTRPAGNQIEDTVTLKYRAARGSAFDFANLYYDFYNHAEHPNPFIFNNNHVSFDTARNADNGVIMAVRSYDAAGKITQYKDDTALFQFEYDASNRPSVTTQFLYSSATGGYEFTYRDLYYYNAAGYLILDSVEQWDGTWKQAEKLKYTYDASGRVTLLSVEYDLPNGSVYTIAHQWVTYPGSLNVPASIVTELTNGHSLDSNYRENFSYLNGALVSHDAYTWSGTWDLYSQERRHLNAANLPDSVFNRYWNAGAAVDSSISKLGYNAQNNPLYRMEYYRNSSLPYVGIRWTYEPTITTNVGRLNIGRLEFYPNPASESVTLKGVNGGSYQIYSNAGQLIQSGKMQSNASISVQMLAPGQYLMHVQDAEGKQMQASFIRL